MTLDGAVEGVSARTVRLLRPNGRRIPAVVSYDTETGQISLEPRRLLPANRNIRVVVDGVTDGDGNALPRTVWRFRTLDDVRPRVVRYTPERGEDVRRGANLRIWVDEKVRRVNRRNVVLREIGGERVPARVSYDGKRRLVLDPTRRLERDTRYVVVLRTRVTDLAGNHLRRTAWRFTTR
jgi:hypothetical protein